MGHIFGKEKDVYWKQVYKNKETSIVNPISFMNQIISETNNIINKNISKVMFIPILLIKEAKLDVYCGSVHAVNPSKLLSLIQSNRYICNISHQDILEIVERMNSVNINVQKEMKQKAFL